MLAGVHHLDILAAVKNVRFYGLAGYAGNTFTAAINDMTIAGCSPCPIVNNSETVSAIFTATAESTTLAFSGVYRIVDEMMNAFTSFSDPILSECLQ